MSSLVLATLIFLAGYYSPIYSVDDEVKVKTAECLSLVSNLAQVQTAWKKSKTGLETIKGLIRENDSALDALATGLISHEFTFLDGRAGGAKTLMAKAILKSELEGISERDKKIFTKQMHQLVTEGHIIGFPKLEGYMKKGEYDIETSTSLSGDKYIFWLLDELEKSLPAVQTKLLSLMNERQAMLGTRVVNAVTRAGISTSNKTIAEFLNSFGEDRATGEALLDRFGIKHTVQNKFIDKDLGVTMLSTQAGLSGLKDVQTAFSDLKDLVDKVHLPRSTLDILAHTVTEFDLYQQDDLEAAMGAAAKSGESQEYATSKKFPANQFTNRSTAKLALSLLKARYILENLKNGVELKDMNFNISPDDLVHLQVGGIQGAVGQLVAKKDQSGRTVIEDDGLLAKYLAIPHLSPAERSALEEIQSKRNTFGTILQKHLDSYKAGTLPRSKPKIVEKVSEVVTDAEVEALKKAKDPKEKLKLAYEITRKNIRQLRGFFPDLDYYLERSMASRIGELNILAFGGPGGAKTMLASILARLEEIGRKTLDPNTTATKFEYQFDKQTPEGIINGFPIPAEQLDKGKVAYNYNGSLADPKNTEGLLDEIDKAHPGTQATALSILNPTERNVMNGETEHQTNIRHITMTSNKLPSEQLESFGDDRSTGEALHDRGIHKVWVMNKFSSPEDVANYLDTLQAKKKIPELKGGTHLGLISELAKKVEAENRVDAKAFQPGADPGLEAEAKLKQIPWAAFHEVWERFQENRQRDFSRSYTAYQEDKATYPHYKLPATEGSNRTYLLSPKVGASALIANQLMNGVEFDKLRYKVDLPDLPFMHQAMLYGVPVKYEIVYDLNNGVIRLDFTKPVPSGAEIARLSKRDQAFAEQAKEEWEDYQSVFNTVLQQSMHGYRELIAQFPDLFPEIAALKKKAEEKAKEAKGKK